VLVVQSIHHLVVEALVGILYLAQSPLTEVAVEVVTRQERAAQTVTHLLVVGKEILVEQAVLAVRMEMMVAMVMAALHILLEVAVVLEAQAQIAHLVLVALVALDLLHQFLGRL
jgi:hypothetical protein